MTDLSCFKAYDIRGKVPDPLSPELAFALGRAVAEHFAARRVVLGYDARLSGPVLHAALAAGLHQAGASATRRLISPLQGQASMRSRTSSARGLPWRCMAAMTSSQGSMPESQ